MKKQTQFKPSLRFPIYSDCWVEKLLGEISTIKTGDKDTQNKIDNGKYPFFVRSNTIERIDSYSYNGEAILTSGDGVGVGKNYHYINGKFDFHQRVYSIRDFDKCCLGKYIFYYFSSKFYPRVIKLSAKNSVDSVRMEMISKMPIPLPSLPEQEKIADFLSAVDKKIESIQKRIDLLKNYKKGLMQKIFSQELRFKAPSGNPFPDWQEKKLGEILKYYRLGGNYENTELETQFPLIKMGNIGRGKMILDKLYYVPEHVDIENDDILQKGDILFNTRNTLELVGKVAIWDNQLTFALYNSNLMKFVFFEDDIKSNKFANLLLNSEPARRGLKRFATGTTSVAAIYTKDLLKLALTIPSPPEQEKIADFLSSIDKKIERAESRLTNLESFKKSLLQKMLV